MFSLKKLRVSLFVILLSSAWAHWLSPRKIDILISIPLAGAHLKTVRDEILGIQEKVKKAAKQHGYELNTNLVTPEKIHITLENINNVDDADSDAYLKCVNNIAKITDAFDITEQFKQAEFQLLGWNKNWGVLTFPSSKNSSLTKLARSIRDCLIAAGLKVGPFEGFKAHVSLGKFVKNHHTPLPTQEHLDWVPKIEMNLPANSFTIENILFSTREKVEDKETGVMAYAAYPAEVFDLACAH